MPPLDFVTRFLRYAAIRQKSKCLRVSRFLLFFRWFR